jgi:hypothetical protein
MVNTNPHVATTILIYLCFCFLELGQSVAREIGLQPADVPVYPGAVDITRTIDQVTRMQTVTYRVGIKYPAPELLEYYDVQLNARGWYSCLDT